MARFALYLLGAPRLEMDGEAIHIRRRKVMALLAYLAVTGRCHQREALATLLWPEYDPSSARADLRRTLSVLNRELGGDGVLADRETAQLNPELELSLDVTAFQQTLAACETHAHPATEVCPACVPLMEQAVALYRDDFLAGFTLDDSAAFDEWQFFQTEGLRDALAGALTRLVEWYSGRGESGLEQAIAYARRWLSLDPLHEPAHRHLIMLYAQSGQRSAALRQYRQCVRLLEEELGVAPIEESTQLYEHIRAERGHLPQADIPPTPPLPHPSTPTPLQLPAFLSDEAPPVTVKEPVFVAREQELARLHGYLDAAMAGQGQVAFVTGGPGRGKTALLRAFTRRAMTAHPDLLVASGACTAYAGIGDPYLPFREVLALLSGDVESRWAAGTLSRDHARRLWTALPQTLPTLVDRGPSLIGTLVPSEGLVARVDRFAAEGDKWRRELQALSERPGIGNLEQSAIFQQISNLLGAIAAKHPLLLTLDDLQWADAGSIGLLFHLGRHLAGQRILILGAYRPEEVESGRQGERHPLDKVLAEFKRQFGDVWVDLRQADAAQGDTFVNALVDTEANRLGQEFRDALFARTGGHPLFTVELLRALEARGVLVRDKEGAWIQNSAIDWETLPARVEAAIAERLGRLNEAQRDLLAVASVEGETFTAQVIAQVQGLEERAVLRTLSHDLAGRHRLVREAEEVRTDGRFLSRYQFAHALFQDYLYHALSNGERRILHGEIATALESSYGAQRETVAVSLAHHFDRAGDREKAIEYALLAGEQAIAAYANEEGLAHFCRALALVEELPQGEQQAQWRWSALKGLGEAYSGMGNAAEAEAYLRQAIVLGWEIGMSTLDLARLYFTMGIQLLWQGKYTERVQLGEEGYQRLVTDPESVEAALMNQTIAMAYNWQGDWDSYCLYTYRTARFARRLSYEPAIGTVYGHIANAYQGNGNMESALDWLRSLKHQASQHHDILQLGEVCSYEAGILLRQGDLNGGHAKQQQALKIYERIGDIIRKGRELCDIALPVWFLGNLQQAHSYASQAIEMIQTAKNSGPIAIVYTYEGRILLSLGDLEGAEQSFVKSRQLHQAANNQPQTAIAIFNLGFVNALRGCRAKAMALFKEALTLFGILALERSIYWFALVLDCLENSSESPAAFHASCRFFQEEHNLTDHPLQWYLEATDMLSIRPGRHSQKTKSSADDDRKFEKANLFDWVWHDPYDDCSYKAQGSLEIYAANGRNLTDTNCSAPRLLQPASGNFVVQTACRPVSAKQPAIGGLLLWQNEGCYIQLTWGRYGDHTVIFSGRRDNRDFLVGRGSLGKASWAGGEGVPSVILRLEQSGESVAAFCSTDGEHWYTVGHTPFPTNDPIQVGVYAIGSIPRDIYHGAFPDGTAIRFTDFRLWNL
ncbi:MAG: AAA family ATPase [Anaerolineae bacterium]